MKFIKEIFWAAEEFLRSNNKLKIINLQWATFLQAKALEKEIDNNYMDAEEVLLIVSPYIKLRYHLKRSFWKASQ